MSNKPYSHINFKLSVMFSSCSCWLPFSGSNRKMLNPCWLLLLLLLSHFSCIRLCATPETAAHQAPPSLGLSRQEHWSGVAISFSTAWKWKVKVKSLSCVWLLATPSIAAHQTPPSMGFSRQEYWSGVPLPSPNFFCFCFFVTTAP